MPIKNIIFDFGNVLIDLDIPKTIRELSKFLGEEVPESLRKELDERIFNVFEVGGMDEDGFVSALQQVAQVPVGSEAILEAWNAMLLQIPHYRFPFLEELAKEYRLFLLSNTNETHLRWVDQYLQNTYQSSIESFNRYFEKAYYSHLIQLRKPGKEIYEFVLADAGIQAQESLFIDDNLQNILGAQSVGLYTIHLGVTEEVVERLPEFLAAHS
jgi:putative hydrolase of the HAD superfamily